MSGGEVGKGFQRPQYFETVNNTLTASTDIVTQFGTVRLCWNETTLFNVVIGPFDPEEGRRVSIRRFLPPHAEGQQLISKFMKYFNGKGAEVEFDLPLPPDVGTESQRAVWSAMREIPYGEYWTYGDLALRLGLPVGRARNVGNATGQNPLPIVYPCHRVVASTGSLTGYSAGFHWKRALLELEGVLVEYDKVRVSEQE